MLSKSKHKTRPLLEALLFIWIRKATVCSVRVWLNFCHKGSYLLNRNAYIYVIVTVFISTIIRLHTRGWVSTWKVRSQVVSLSLAKNWSINFISWEWEWEALCLCALSFMFVSFPNGRRNLNENLNTELN